MDEVPWLREMVDDDLLAIFSADEEEIARGVRELIALSADDPGVEERLIDLLQTSLEHGNDDTSASVWAAVILGEIRSQRALPVLEQGIASDADEMLQDAAGVALLRIGPPAVEAIMEAADDEAGPVFRRAAYAFLGMVGALEDRTLCERVADFIEARIEAERRLPPAERAIEELLVAAAQIGSRRHLPAMKRILQDDFGGHNVVIQDAIERLEENVEGAPFVATTTPWEDRYGWIFPDERQEARVSRSSSGKIFIEPAGAPPPERRAAAGRRPGEGGAKAEGRSHKRRRDKTSRYLRGLNLTDEEEREDSP